ncbi:MAE_28990/MAE_18760 family HEPN-like nuclease [Desulfosporosinus acidiphilus]|uniref:MAE_28990/MAE_18760 family HEPN-like nuclease n=1 Tax=Desulfosporosinus acidiphilus TaxID=885581 RepID=UPI000257AF10|nr:MAE_28990/MAE_18760 family HEPN-like nuclease [Desulfosporosinus acidiphilus]
MLYSHYEGFCKTAFLIYVKSINQEKILRSIANDFMVAGSLSEVFKAFNNTDKKCKVFKNALPHDEKLHRFAREVDLVKEFDNFLQQIINIPESIVDVESNLKPLVLRKMLYRLGFQYDTFQVHEGLIDQLLNYRNNIAHGAIKNGLEQSDYDSIEKATYIVMEEIKKMIIDALQNKLYLKSTATPP